MKTITGTSHTSTITIRTIVRLLAAFTFLISFANIATANQNILPTIDQQSAISVRADVERSLWVWSSEDIVYSVGSAKADFFSFCENPKGLEEAGAPEFSRHPINHLFFYAHGFVVSGQEEMDSLRAFLREAHTRNIRVDYLDGEATWINKDAGEANQVINSVVTFNKLGQPEERFDGVMLDVQPYTLRGWYTAALWNQYVTFLHSMRSKIHTAGVDFGVTIPRWYDATLGTQALADVYSNVNYVAVLDYVDQERALVESISNEIDLADSMNVRVYAGVETASNVISTVTFQEKGWMAMEHALSTLNSAFMFDKSFAGIAIDNYASYRNLRRAPHTIDLAANTTIQNASSIPALLVANADVLVLDNAIDHIAGVTKKDLQKVQTANNLHRDVLAGLNIGSFINIAAHPGAPVGDENSWSLVGMNGPTQEMKNTVTKLMALGFDGFSIDLTAAVDLSQRLNDVNLERAIVRTVSELGQLARETCKHSSAVIVTRGGEALLNKLDAESYSSFVSTVDGIMPTQVTSAPPAMISALDRDRFYIYASLEHVAKCGIKVFGDFNFCLSPELLADSRPMLPVPMMAGLLNDEFDVR